METIFRMAKPEDAIEVAGLLHKASGGLSDFLLQDILPNCEIIDLIALGVTDKEATISFSKTLVAEQNQKIMAILNFYPVSEHQLPDIMQTFIPKERIEHIANFFNYFVPDSLYLHALAVREEIASYSMASSLILKIIQYATKLGIKKLSAHVWQNNERVLNVLLRKGFTVYKRIKLDHHALLPNKDEMILLSYVI